MTIEETERVRRKVAESFLGLLMVPVEMGPGVITHMDARAFVHRLVVMALEAYDREMAKAWLRFVPPPSEN